jgi:thioredoxin-related protein
MKKKVVVMNLKNYLKEHRHLIKLLKSAHKPAFTKEANEQIKEVKRELRKLKLKT